MHTVVAMLVLAAATSYKPSVSLTTPVNPQLVQRRDAIAAKLTPSARQKLHTIATSLVTSSITDGTTHAAITSTFGNLNGADIEALAFIVLMDASQSAQQDLQSIMAHVKAIDNAKQELRSSLAGAHQQASTPAIHKVQAQLTPTSFTMPPALPPNATIAQKQQRLDDLNELGEQEQLKMQKVISQMQAAQQMASNVAKKLSDSTSSILRNLK